MKRLFKNIKLFKLFGVNIFLNVTWFFVFILFFTWSGTTVELFLTELAIVLILFTTVLFHEFGHVLAARKYGVNTDKIVLHILGGAAFINAEESEKLTPKKMIWVYFAGPLVNIILGTVTFIILMSYLWITGIEILDTFSTLIGFTFVVNLVMVVFNLLPIFPMDGGGILRNFMEHRGVKNYLVISARVSQVLCLGLLALCLFVGSITGIIISVIFFIYAVVELKKAKSEDGIVNLFGLIELDYNKEEPEEDLEDK